MSQYFNAAYQYLTNVSRDTPKGRRKTHPSLTPQQKEVLENIKLDLEGVDWVGKTEGFFSKVYNDRKGNRGKKASETDFGRQCGYKYCYPPLANRKVGHPTIGYGKLLLSNEIAAGIWAPFLKNGPARMTKPEAKKILKLGIEKHLRRFIHKLTRVPTQNQLTAFTSFVFNTGGNQNKFIPILAAFNAGDDVKVARLLRIYNGTTRLEHGHVKRRFNEAELYAKGDYKHPYRDIPKSAIAGFQSSGTGAAGDSTSQGPKGKVYILGDSNTRPHLSYWRAYAKKNFGSNIDIIDRVANGHTLKKMLGELKGVEEAKAIIIGSGGGVNTSGFGHYSDRQAKRLYTPNGDYSRNNVRPLFEKLKQLQSKGTKIVFFGLPFGRDEGDKCKNNRANVRKQMDETLKVLSSEYGIPYKSVFATTEKIKGDACGVHYSTKQYGAVRNALRGADPEGAVAAAEERAYARGNKKIKLVSNRFLKPYRYVKTAWTAFTFDKLYAEFEKHFGPKWAEELLPDHGADKIFGPEHHAATVAIAEKTGNQNLISLLNKKPTGAHPDFFKAEKKAEDSIEDIEADNISQLPGADDPIAEPPPRMTDLLGTEKPKTVVKKEPAKPKPITIEQAILVSKQGDVLDLKVKKEVTHKIDLGITTKDITIFKKGKSYKGKVLAGNKITFKREPIFTRGDSETMTKTEFIKTMKEHGGDPCNILDCQLSTITRAGTKKTFAEFLKDPSFGTQLAENKTKRKIRIILNC